MHALNDAKTHAQQGCAMQFSGIPVIEISRSRFKQSKKSMLIALLYVLGCFINFRGNFGYILEEIVLLEGLVTLRFLVTVGQVFLQFRQILLLFFFLGPGFDFFTAKDFSPFFNLFHNLNKKGHKREMKSIATKSNIENEREANHM